MYINYDQNGEASFSRNYTTRYFISKRRKELDFDEEEVVVKKVSSTRSPKWPKSQHSDGDRGSVMSIEPTPELYTYGGIKLGWIQGVLIPCLLNIWGVMLFLRISWIVGQAGTAATMGIILISGVVCVITTLSLSAICTNGQLKGGGVYYLVSRSLGAELGASVGIIFAVANAVAASMNTIGFCDSLNELLKSHQLKIIDNGVNDTRIVGAVALLVMCLICAIGMDWETKTQNFLITVIVLAIVNFIVGVAMGPRNDTEIARGFVGVNTDTIKQNMLPDFRFSEGVHHDAFTVFAIYFPAVTGVQAGANICGDLRDPATAIPKGTLLALLISLLSYALIAVLCGASALRDASGVAGDLTHAALSACSPNCTYGLHNDYEVMKLMSAWGPLLYGGCWAATLSTALTNLLSVPRLIQALGVDRIYPGLIFFSKPYGKHGEPYRGYLLTFFVSLLFLLIADLNTIAPLISNFYLASYALINFCTFHAAFVHHISWRPTFRFYNLWVSLLGTLLCGIIMVMLSWPMAMITVIIFLALYLIVLYRKPEADWGSSTEAQRYLDVLQSLAILNQRHSVKSYNPQLLVMAGPPGWRPALLQVASLITPGTFSLVAEINEIMSGTIIGSHETLPMVADYQAVHYMVGHYFGRTLLAPSLVTFARLRRVLLLKLPVVEREARIAIAYRWLSSKSSSSFFTLLDGIDLETGARALLQASGLGRLAPNILLLGFKYDWAGAEDTEEYVRVMRMAFEHKLGVTILRTPPEYRASEILPPVTMSSELLSPSSVEMGLLMYQDSDLSIEDANHQALSSERNLKAPSINWKIQEDSGERPPGASPKSKEYKPFTLQNSTLDAWWLYDDGGLNILLPYIIACRGARPPAQLRILALARDARNRSDAETQLKALLAKYRIRYSSLTLLTGVNDPPTPVTRDLFHSLLHHTDGDSDSLVAEAHLTRWHVKTSRQLRLRELLLEHSSKAAFIVMNMPRPRRGLPARLYMSWLEMLSRDLPPMLLVRGNDEQVLTYEA